MKQKLSPQTSSFIILATLSFFGAFLVIVISNNILKNNIFQKLEPLLNQSSGSEQTKNLSGTISGDQLKLPDITSWKDHKYTQFGITFKTPPAWKVALPKTVKGFEVGEINPGQEYPNIKIYISPKDFYVMDGLPAIKTSIDGQPALNVSNMLYGISANGYYFTFDLGYCLPLTPEFNAMVKSIKFVKQ